MDYDESHLLVLICIVGFLYDFLSAATHGGLEVF